MFLPLTPTLKIANSLLDTIIFKLTQKSSRKTKTTSRLLRNFPRCTELTSKGGWGQERPKKQADNSRIKQFSKGTYGQKQSLGDRGLITQPIRDTGGLGLSGMYLVRAVDAKSVNN